MSMMLPFGITTLVCPSLADHPALVFTAVHVPLYVSSPKNHAHPSGPSAEVSVNCTVRGAGPEIVLLLNAASGAAALAVPISSRVAATRHSVITGMLLGGFPI
ncbi:hypothetical protein DSECCO2_395000 [anaerobic digester metagenome]